MQTMNHADIDKDGIVTRQELTAEISNRGKRSPQEVERIVDSLMSELDTDKDGKLSIAETLVGARKTTERMITKADVRRAQEIMFQLGTYKKTHNGSLPAKLDELEKLNLVNKEVLLCTMTDGSEKAWKYTPEKSANSVIILSPGAVDSDGQYIAGLNDGRVLGMQDKDLSLEKIPGSTLQVYPDKSDK